MPSVHYVFIRAGQTVRHNLYSTIIINHVQGIYLTPSQTVYYMPNHRPYISPYSSLTSNVKAIYTVPSTNVRLSGVKNAD
jgi:hypothetical protein